MSAARCDFCTEPVIFLLLNQRDNVPTFSGPMTRTQYIMSRGVALTSAVTITMTYHPHVCPDSPASEQP